MRYQPGQALFDPFDPVSPIARAESPFLRCGESEALRGQVDNVCFAQGLVLFDDTWCLYYGMADSRIGCATAPLLGREQRHQEVCADAVDQLALSGGLPVAGRWENGPRCGWVPRREEDDDMTDVPAPWSIRSALVGVADLDRSLAFYEDVTNLHEILRADRMVVLGLDDASSFTLYLRHTGAATHPGQQAVGVRSLVLDVVQPFRT